LRQDPGIDRDLSDVAGILTRSDFAAQGEIVARMIPTEHFSLRALGSILRQLALHGNQARARELADEIVTRITRLDLNEVQSQSGPYVLVESYFDLRHALQTISALASAFAEAGFTGHASMISSRYRDEQLRPGVHENLFTGPYSVGSWSLEPGSYYEQKDTVFGIPEDDEIHIQVARGAREAAQEQEFNRAEQIAHDIIHPEWRGRALADIACEAAKAGEYRVARKAARDAGEAIRCAANDHRAPRVMFMLASAASAFADSGHADQALAVYYSRVSYV
jgi:hypothetical protein